MKISAIIMMVLSVSFAASAGLSDAEIMWFKGRGRTQRRPEQSRFQPKQYPRRMAKPERHFNYHSRKPLPGDMFAETMVNNLVRFMTIGLRRRTDSNDRNITWQTRRKGYSVSYSLQVKDGSIIREVCVMKFPGLPEVRTINGKLDAPVGFSAANISWMLYVLNRDNIDFPEMTLRINHRDSDSFDKLYRTLRKYDYPVQRVNCQESSQIYIRLKLS